MIPRFETTGVRLNITTQQIQSHNNALISFAHAPSLQSEGLWRRMASLENNFNRLYKFETLSGGCASLKTMHGWADNAEPRVNGLYEVHPLTYLIPFLLSYYCPNTSTPVFYPSVTSIFHLLFCRYTSLLDEWRIELLQSMYGFLYSENKFSLAP